MFFLWKEGLFYHDDTPLLELLAGHDVKSEFLFYVKSIITK